MNFTEGSQPCETTSNFQSPIVLTDIPIVAPDVVIPIKCSQPGERIIRNQPLHVGALKSNGAKYGKQYKRDRLYSKTNNIRRKVKISERSFRPRYNIPLLIGSNFDFIPERVKDDGRVVEHGESPTVQFSQLFGGLPVPYTDKCMNYH